MRINLIWGVGIPPNHWVWSREQSVGPIVASAMGWSAWFILPIRYCLEGNCLVLDKEAPWPNWVPDRSSRVGPTTCHTGVGPLLFWALFRIAFGEDDDGGDPPAINLVSLKFRASFSFSSCVLSGRGFKAPSLHCTKGNLCLWWDPIMQWHKCLYIMDFMLFM